VELFVSSNAVVPSLRFTMKLTSKSPSTPPTFSRSTPMSRFVSGSNPSTSAPWPAMSRLANSLSASCRTVRLPVRSSSAAVTVTRNSPSPSPPVTSSKVTGSVSPAARSVTRSLAVTLSPISRATDTPPGAVPLFVTFISTSSLSPSTISPAVPLPATLRSASVVSLIALSTVRLPVI